MAGAGRHVYGLAAIGLGICMLVWPAFIWQLEPPARIPPVLIACFALMQIGGGVAIQFPRFARGGAAVVGVVYAIFTVLWLPLWIQHPLIFDSLGNAFEQFAMLCGALILYGGTAARVGYYGFGVSVLSFALYQAIHPDVTAQLVPKWIPPGQTFWANATTIAFALAGIALLMRRSALLSARLTTLMLMLFGLLIWVPATRSGPRSVGNWAEMGLTFGIAGAAWVVADYLARHPARRLPGRR